MKNKILLFLALILLLPINAQAIYNGGDGGGSTPTGKTCPTNSSKLCLYNNAHHMTVLISLYYFDSNGGRQQIGKSVVYTNNNMYKISDFYTFNVTGNASEGYNASGLKNYFYENIDNFITLLNRAKNFGLTKENYKEKLDEYFTNFCANRGKDASTCSQKAPGEYGFRIVIEPYVSGFIKKQLYFMTPKEIAKDGGITNSGNTMSIYSWLLHTEFTDVGITSYNSATSNLSLIANPNSGYGYNIIDFAITPDKLFKEACKVTNNDVETCCLKYNITTNNFNNNPYNKKYDPNTKEGYLTREIKLEELYDTKCDKTEKTDCKYSIDAQIPNVCSAETNGLIKDIASWKCIFESTKNSDESIKKHYFDGFSNEYCAFYCSEEINYQFPDGSNVVDPGRYLTIKKESIDGDLSVISPIKYKGVKICRTTNEKGSNQGKIDKNEFLNDINEIEQSIKKSWDTYSYLKNNNGKAKEITEAKQKYDNLINKRTEMINQINACSTKEISYSFSPKIKFTYEEPVYGGTYELSKETNVNKSVTYYIGGNGRLGTSEQAYSYIVYDELELYDCNLEQGCQKTLKSKYPRTDWIERKIEKNINYTLPDDLYKYIRKDYGASVNLLSEAGKNYIINESNLPIHYSTNPGDYDFSIIVETLGEDNKFNNYIYNKKKFAGKIVYDGKNQYNCTYKISCKKFINNQTCKEYCDECPDNCNDDKCPSEGVNLVYRTISLFENQSFLNMDGSIRMPGANWNVGDVVSRYIVNNRDVKEYDVYKLDPMYEITLTPSLIKEIKAYNKSQNAKKLTIYNGSKKSEGIAGYADFESMTCDQNGKNCVSSKLRQWGVKGCAINGTNYQNCGNTEAW